MNKEYTEFVLSQQDLQNQNNPLFLKIFEYYQQEGRVFLLQGEVAAGKTTLVQSFGKILGIDSITSPTFNLLQTYPSTHQSISFLHHYDLYRYELNDILELGITEEIQQKGIHFIEWGDEKIETICMKMGIISLKVGIEALRDKRKYRIGLGQCTL
ncbi:tRNA (adenosine(37)-N6)-threonylcarbamoyltransferase complex ATPase subunit type 1 TsaE [Helicobacter monodelphidis]|uniref:tRNA (adenosine(37)-N6)-threonylcarbamoyltransferase complex ATPase subunit type 1 TsaE n=1 Tax=Helicobacter sp. 15-1451 TaxID=2004995 RepID=UPI000DCD6EF4|nr:tRNA (adenosine(37)-N6)-threonylcarbamoyltransferase complex ATPase subunit type 1 TsaE [Helicobacter sp. 15-1451]RAX58627.1 tRNA (adenosine(37)-N6)-threonylcarbamoyltransferase complex ATPase subunit type 1 TsaE [Helicobacter sp. 15-1451]